MNKAQKDIQKYTLEQEKEILSNLKQSYKDAEAQIDAKLADLMGRHDLQNLQSIIYQRQYQEMLKRQIDEILVKMDNVSTLEDYLKNCYETGYIGTFYDIMKQGVPITTPINQNQMVKCFTNTSSQYKSIVDAVGFTNEKTSKLVRGAMSRGIASGMSYAEIGRNIENSIGVGYRNSVRIARTEGHRVQQSANMDALHEAKEAGADVVKQWCSTLDDRTRPTHQQLDGQIVEVDEPFVNMYGMEAMFPSDFGDASEDINCRCCLLERAKWNLDQDELQTLKNRAEYFGLDKSDSFKDFKEKFLQNVTDEVVPENNPLFKTTTKLKNAMSEEDYKEYLNIVSKNPDIANLYSRLDDLDRIECLSDAGAFYPASNRIEFSYPSKQYIEDGMSKFHTLAHESGHFFDRLEYKDLTFNEYNDVSKIINRKTKPVASSSDQFLSALRKDYENAKQNYKEIHTYCRSQRNTSVGVQDAMDGLKLGTVAWGHGDIYYNKFYNNRVKGTWVDNSKELKEYYLSLGMDASNQGKVKTICRQYRTGSELWANICSAYTTGGKELESLKKCFPESTSAFLEIIGKGMK